MLHREINKQIREGSIIVLDLLKGYIVLDAIGYEPHTINQSIQFISSEGYCTTTTKGSWYHLKRALPINLRPGTYYTYIGQFM